MLAFIRGAVLALSGFLLIGCSSGPNHDLRSSSAVKPARPVVTPGAARDTIASTPAGRLESPPHPMLLGVPIATVPVREITLSELRQHVREQTAAFIDARGTRDFERGHVRGARNVPPSQLDTSMEWIRQNIAPNQLTIIYCASLHCESSEMVYEYLQSQGYTNLRVFKPGWEALAEQSEVQ